MHFTPRNRKDYGRVYVARDTNGHEWMVYKSYGTRLWHYIRDDHDVSSIGYLTLGDAQKALTSMFEGIAQ